MFSVIIPVHNAECTLERCIQSVLTQDYFNFEILLIHNGSTDQSWELCQKWTARDRRIRAWDIGKCNGPAKPRNFGLAHAGGSYIVFLDADDKLEVEALKVLHHSFTDADIVFWGRLEENVETGEQKTIFPSVVFTEDCKLLAYLLKKDDCFGYVGCKAFRKIILQEHRFPEDIDLFEDEIFTLKVIEKNTRVKLLKQVIYHYYTENKSALTHHIHKDILYKKNLLYRSWKDFLGKMYPEQLQQILTSSVSYLKFYVYEHALALKPFLYEFQNSELGQDAQRAHIPFAEFTKKGLLFLYMDYALWKTKKFMAGILRK